MDQHTAYKLEPPGSGLPSVELFVGKVLLELRRWTGTRDAFHSKFEHERLLIRLLLERVHADSGRLRVLIPRIRGLEDSSRDWSVWMVLDHLRIVNSEIARILADLVEGRAPAVVTSIAAVKPSQDAGPEVGVPYHASCERLQTTAVAADDLTTAKRHAHPWFGPMNAMDWYGLAGVHLAIHRMQIQRILQRISNW